MEAKLDDSAILNNLLFHRTTTFLPLNRLDLMDVVGLPVLNKQYIIVTTEQQTLRLASYRFASNQSPDGIGRGPALGKKPCIARPRPSNFANRVL